MLNYLIHRVGKDRCINLLAGIYIFIGIEPLFRTIQALFYNTIHLDFFILFLFLGYFLLRRSDVARKISIGINFIILIGVSAGFIVLNASLIYFLRHFEMPVQFFCGFYVLLNIIILLSIIISSLSLCFFMRPEIRACFFRPMLPRMQSQKVFWISGILGCAFFFTYLIPEYDVIEPKEIDIIFHIADSGIHQIPILIAEEKYPIGFSKTQKWNYNAIGCYPLFIQGFYRVPITFPQTFRIQKINSTSSDTLPYIPRAEFTVTMDSPQKVKIEFYSQHKKDTSFLPKNAILVPDLEQYLRIKRSK